jgi:ribosomal-protein-serine acetyltransferase
MSFAVHATSSDGRISIRPYRGDDTAALFEAVRESVDQIAPWLDWCHPNYSRSDSETWVSSRDAAWRRGVEYSFVIVDAATQTFLGGCGLNDIHPVHGFANLGYWVRRRWTGRGAATAAAGLVARFGFEQRGLKRIEIVAAVDNKASQRVAEKAGAHREGVLRCRLTIHGKVHDAVLYSLIPADLGDIGGRSGRPA